MTEQELKTLKEQIKQELLAGKEQERRNKNAFSKIMNELSGKLVDDSEPYRNAKLHRLRMGLSAVVRWAFGCDTTANIPAERAEDVRVLVEGIIRLCDGLRQEKKSA